jgi:alpha-L-glutamate ligase-like protein
MLFSNDQQILGMNARNQLYLKLNGRSGRRIADSKLLTKQKLGKAGLPTPQLLAVFRNEKDVIRFNWEKLQDNFVVKPVSGFGGGGVLVVRKKVKNSNEWYLMDNSKIDVGDLRFHCLDILMGQYSLHELPDMVMVEERIKIAKAFRHYAYQGTPDIRVIVFNKVPVMAMLRLPTAQSKGKANLHQGAIGVGIDLSTGITTYGFNQFAGHFVKIIPETNRKINGIKLPHWGQILTLAAKAQESLPSLGFVGVDIVLDKERGPLVLELNARPGLEIQNANMLPLKKRLERVEGLEVMSAEHGVKIAQTLFASRFADRVMAEEGVKILDIREPIKLVLNKKGRYELSAKIDTGAWRTSIDKELADELGLLKPENIITGKYIKSSLGIEERPFINLSYYLAGRRINTVAGIANRRSLKTPMIIGRRDLEGFLVRPRS